MLTFYCFVQEYAGQKLHLVANAGGLATVALCGRHNQRRGCWQMNLLGSVDNGCCGNCLRVAKARKLTQLNQVFIKQEMNDGNS